MTQKDLNELKEFFKENYPHVLQNYNLLYNIRTNDRKFEFLLAFESLLTLIFITLFSNSILRGDFIFIIPLMAFFVSILFSLSNIIPIQTYFHWFDIGKIKEIFEGRKDKDFSEQGLRDIYGVAPHLWELNQRKNRIFRYNALSLHISIVLSFTGILIHIKTPLLLMVFIPLTILTWVLVEKYWGKEAVKKNPSLEIEEFFNKWKEEVRNKK